STECYRNWWPGPGNAMVALMNRSINLLEHLADESRNHFLLNRRGYLYLTANEALLPKFIQQAQEPAALGAGELRIHYGHPDDPEYSPSPPEGYLSVPDGADLILDQGLIQKYFPYVSKKTRAALHVRRAGWFSAHQLGSYLLEQAFAHCVKLVAAEVTGVEIFGGRIHGVQLSNGHKFATHYFINAAGPMLDRVGRMLGIELPVFSELHLKASFRDVQHFIPREAPLLIWSDSQQLQWTGEERDLLEEEGLSWLMQEMPSGIHTRPEGGADSDILLMLWEYHTQQLTPVFPPPLDEMYPEIVLRGLEAMLPAMKQYIGRAGRPYLDGGYYTKTKENRPLIGPLPVKGSYVIGALSGFGLMAACAAGELLAAHITGSSLPDYAP
ncbi:MAG: NAD(P)/FAD-dependent oxidoreductase, partial [bacterium]